MTLSTSGNDPVYLVSIKIAYLPIISSYSRCDRPAEGRSEKNFCW